MLMDRKIQYCQDVSSSKLGLQIQCNLNQNPRFFVEINKLLLKCIQKCKEPKITKAILKRKNKSDLTLISRLNYKSTMIKIVQYYLVKIKTNRSMEQNSPELGLRIYRQLIFDKGAKAIPERSLQQMVLEQLISTCKNTELQFIPYTIHKN